MKISSGIKENGIVVGNAYDKYNTKNPLAKILMNGFETTLKNAVTKRLPASINEIGCGEGFWVLYWKQLFGNSFPSTGSDFSSKVIELAKKNAEMNNINPEIFKVHSVYDLIPQSDEADMIICCEVLEHLENPELALEKLSLIVRKNLIISVPNEPLWRILNMIRFRYTSALGNTPGHIQHWSSKQFVSLVSQYFTVLETYSPIPWTMLVCKQK